MSDPKKNSHAITTGPNRAPARSMLKAVGFTDEDLRKPIVGVASTWIEIGPCNYHLRRLSQKVKEGIRAAGGTPMEFNTVSISDGITMGAEGMKTSLISREVIADSIELVARGNHFDAIVCISGCDKTNPGVMMALARSVCMMPLRKLWRHVASPHFRLNSSRRFLCTHVTKNSS